MLRCSATASRLVKSLTEACYLSTMQRKSIHLALLGAPGSGKGTQAKYIHKDFSLSIISTGDLLRQEIYNKTEIGSKVSEIVSKGGLVGDEIMREVVVKAFKSAEAAQGWILDGYPRTLDQGQMLMELLESLRTPLDAVFHIQVDYQEIIERLTGRLVHEASGRLYHVSFNPPKVPGRDDVTGEPLVRRPDDAPEVVVRRLQEFDQRTQPLLEFFEKRRLLRIIPSPTSVEGYKVLKPMLEQLLA